jgi:hypothetical protein
MEIVEGKGQIHSSNIDCILQHTVETVGFVETVD